MATYVDASGNVVTYDPVSGDAVSSAGEDPRLDPGTNPGAPKIMGAPSAPGAEPPKTLPSGSLFSPGTVVPNPAWQTWKTQSDAFNAWLAANPIGGTGTAAGGTAGNAATAPKTGGLSPSDPAYWLALGNSPPWIAAGYPDFGSWSNAIGSKNALAEAQARAQLAYTQAQIGNLGAGSAQSAYDAAQSRAQQQRQFEETLGYNKAVNDQTRANQAADREVNKGNTLLGLGQRPDTLIKYLYALRGQQTPQAIAGTTTNLPGYQNVIGQPNPGATVPGGVSSSSPSGTVSLNLPNDPARTAPRLGEPGAPNVLTNENLTLAAQSPSLSTALGLPNVPHLAPQNINGQNVTFSPLVTNAQGGTTFANSLGNIIKSGPGALPSDITIDKYGDIKSAGAQAMAAAATPQQLQQSWDDYNNQQSQEHEGRGYAEGGVIAEPMIAVGLNSGRVITLGEEAPAKPEVVVPQGKTLDQVKGEHSKTAYATGGSLGYDPSRVPSLGSQSSEFFNNPYLKTVVDRGYNSDPSTPLFPQVGIATGGGQSLIPSMQRLNSLLPSEQSLYAGALQDEFGANAQDVFSLARNLGPQVTGLRTPRFTN